MTSDSDRDLLIELRDLCMELGEVEDDIANIESSADGLRAQRLNLREKISLLSALYGESVKIFGFGTVTISKPSAPKPKYDGEAIDDLLIELKNQKLDWVVNRLLEVRSETKGTSGGLVIVRSKKNASKAK